MKGVNDVPLISLRGIATLSIFIISVSIFILIGHEVVLEKEDWFDSSVFNFLKSHLSPQLLRSFKFLTFFGSFEFTLVSWAVLLLVLFIKHRRKEVQHLAALAITSTILLRILKAVFARQRPELALTDPLPGYSFPSGHASGSIILCFTLITLVWQSSLDFRYKCFVSILLFVFALSIGISRIVLRLHYASDVLGGFTLGIAYYILFNKLHYLFVRK